MQTLLWVMVIMLTYLLRHDHPILPKVGMVLTGLGAGVSVGSASQINDIVVWGVSAPLDEWKVWGIMAGVAFGAVGIAIQIVGVILNELHRRRQG